MATQTLSTGSTVRLVSNAYTNPGYMFSGWNTSANGSGTGYSNDASIAMGEASITLYAVWSPNNDTITFNANGGQGSMSAQTLSTGSSARLASNAFSYSGFTFSRWDTSADGTGTGYSDGASFAMGAASVTLYAIWTRVDSDFTIVMIPDSQNEVDVQTPVWRIQNKWILENQVSRNIRAVIGVGDVANSASDIGYTTATAQGYDLLSTANIPNMPILGNHDYSNLATRNTDKWDQYFGPGRYLGKEWFIDGYPLNSTANIAIKFSVNQHNYLVVGLEFFPRASAVSWAQSVITANPDREVIISTHAYLTNTGARYSGAEAYGPIPYGFSTQNSGQALWDSLIKLNKNIILVLCGHDIGGPFEAHLSSTGYFGNVVHQIFANYQTAANSGDGAVLLLKF